MVYIYIYILLFRNEDAGHIQEIDVGLLNDFFKNHYPKIKRIWENVVNSYEQKYETDSRINKIIENNIKNTLDKIGLKYKTSLYEYESAHVNAVPILEVRDRLRNLIENKRFEHEIENKLKIVIRQRL